MRTVLRSVCVVNTRASGKKTWNVCFFLTFALTSALLITQAASAVMTQPYRTIALSGQQAPGAPEGVVFSNESWIAPVINNTGQAAFLARMIGPGIDYSNQDGLWSEGHGSLQLIARDGDSAPGMSEDRYYMNLGLPVLNDLGQIAFAAQYDGPGVVNSQPGLWSEGYGSLHLVAAAGELAPGADPGQTFQYLGEPRFNSSGSVVFQAKTENFSDGIWSDTNTGLRVEAIDGTTGMVAGEPESTVFIDFGRNSPPISDAGHLVYLASIYPTPPLDWPTGIWMNYNNTSTRIVREGDLAPGVSPPSYFGDFTDFSDYHPTVNNAGDVAFLARLADENGEIEYKQSTSLWLKRDGVLNMVARVGDAAPDLPDDIVFDDFDFTSQPLLSNSGHVLFKAELMGPGVDDTNNESLWIQDADQISMIARTGEPAVGLPDGMTFSSFWTKSVNASGEVIFLAVASDSLGRERIEGIWVYTTRGKLHLLLKEGDLFDVNDDPFVEDMRTIASVRTNYYNGVADGQRRGFNDAGQLGISLKFTDDSTGLFIANTRVLVPEPTALAVFSIGALTICRRRLN